LKPVHIILIIVLVVIIGIIISTVTNTSTYADFATAQKNSGKEVQIIGKLNKDKPILYDSKINANQFSFYLIDNKGVEKMVVYYDAKPQDFEKSEKVVVSGKMKDNIFIASSILLKCPSKYKSDSTPEQFGERNFGKK